MNLPLSLNCSSYAHLFSSEFDQPAWFPNICIPSRSRSFPSGPCSGCFALNGYASELKMRCFVSVGAFGSEFWPASLIPFSKWQNNGKQDVSFFVVLQHHIHHAGVLLKQTPYSWNCSLTGNVSLDCCQYKQILSEVKFGFGRSLRGSVWRFSLARRRTRIITLMCGMLKQLWVLSQHRILMSWHSCTAMPKTTIIS